MNLLIYLVVVVFVYLLFGYISDSFKKFEKTNIHRITILLFSLAYSYVLIGLISNRQELTKFDKESELIRILNRDDNFSLPLEYKITFYSVKLNSDNEAFERKSTITKGVITQEKYSELTNRRRQKQRMDSSLISFLSFFFLIPLIINDFIFDKLFKIEAIKKLINQFKSKESNQDESSDSL